MGRRLSRVPMMTVAVAACVLALGHTSTAVALAPKPETPAAPPAHSAAGGAIETDSGAYDRSRWSHRHPPSPWEPRPGRRRVFRPGADPREECSPGRRRAFPPGRRRVFPPGRRQSRSPRTGECRRPGWSGGHTIDSRANHHRGSGGRRLRCEHQDLRDRLEVERDRCRNCHRLTGFDHDHHDDPRDLDAGGEWRCRGPTWRLDDLDHRCRRADGGPCLRTALRQLRAGRGIRLPRRRSRRSRRYMLRRRSKRPWTPRRLS